nr:cytochrome c peroxidase [Falsiruegeria mediterranea]
MIRYLIALCLGTSAWADGLPLAEPVFPPLDMAEVELGHLLFYDPVLSGSRTVSCATCHHPRFATSDGVSLGIGDGGVGLGPDRVFDAKNRPEQRIPRNSPALFNLGATEFTSFFHDGRLEVDETRPSGIRTPLGAEMEHGFASVLSAQTMFPVLSGDEMAGHYSENDVAQAVRQGFLTGPGGAWDILSNRVEALPEYRDRFDQVIGERPIAFTDISNMIAAFIAFEWRADDSPFDRHLRGKDVLSTDELRGMTLFYGEAGCASCHSGWFQTDHGFHAIAMPQIGPGKAARFERHNRDVGRMRVTGRSEDAFAFRTPSLRNVTQTAPYGHSGAYATLDALIRHHLDPVQSLQSYTPDHAVLPAEPFETDFVLLTQGREVDDIARANALPVRQLTDDQIADLLAFLGALSDETALKGRLGVPDAVPSGLTVEK